MTGEVTAEPAQPTAVRPLLSVEHLSVTYRGARQGLRRAHVLAADDVTFSISEGETFGLVGESGSGKTTVGRAVLGLLSPAGGEILLHGRDVAKVRRGEVLAYRQAAQVVFQDPTASLNPARTIAATLSEPLDLHRGLRGVAAIDAIWELLGQVSLPPGVAGRLPAELSGGQRQRAAIGRALAPKPKLIVCDEPITSLDVSIQAQVINLLADLRAADDLTLLFISHDLGVVRHIAQRVGVMFGGRLVETGPTALICGDPAHPYTRALLAAAPVPDPARQRLRRQQRRAELTASGASGAPGGVRPACGYAVRCPLATGECLTVRPELAPLPDGRLVACHHPHVEPSESAAKPRPAGQDRRPLSPMPGS